MNERESSEPNRINLNPDQPFDLSELQRQAGKDPDFIVDMLETLFISTNKGIDELERDLANERWDSVNLVSHRLASPLRFIMAKSVYDLVKKIEFMTEKDVPIEKEKISAQLVEFKAQYLKLESLLQSYIKKELVH